MSGNTLGTLFTVTTFGESHGPAIGCVIDGCPPGMALSEADIQPDLDRRKPGTSRHVTQRREDDLVEILSGVYEGETTGTPIALLIRDSCGAKLTVVAEGVPPGWGEPLYGRLDADIAQAMMGINAVKGVEIGAGFRAVEQMGTEHSDEMTPEGFLSNNAGGILGGISTGQDVVVSIAIKPTSSIRLARRTIDVEGNAATIETHGRHDPCVGIRATPIAEAFLALVLIDHALRQRAQNGDVAERGARIPAQAAKAAAAAGVALEDPDPLEA